MAEMKIRTVTKHFDDGVPPIVVPHFNSEEHRTEEVEATTFVEGVAKICWNGNTDDLVDMIKTRRWHGGYWIQNSPDRLVYESDVYNVYYYLVHEDY